MVAEDGAKTRNLSSRRGRRNVEACKLSPEEVRILLRGHVHQPSRLLQL